MLIDINEIHVHTGISQINNICTIYSEKPHQEDDDMYGRIGIVSDDPTSINTNDGKIQKIARISITLVSPLHIPEDDTATSMLRSMVSIITNGIVGEHCQKDIDWDGLKVVSVTQGGTSPILYTTKDRAVQQKDYFITYNCK